MVDAAVIGVPNERSGEAPLAFVVLANESSVDEDDVERFVAERVAPFKRITGGVRFVQSLPKSAAGKILRRILKDEYMKNSK